MRAAGCSSNRAARLAVFNPGVRTEKFYRDEGGRALVCSLNGERFRLKNMQHVKQLQEPKPWLDKAWQVRQFALSGAEGRGRKA